MEYPLEILTELVLYNEQVTSNSNISSMVLKTPCRWQSSARTWE